MIPKTRGPVQTIPLHSEKEIRWQQLLAESKITLPELLDRLQLSPATNTSAAVTAANQQFPLRVPEPYLSRIKPDDAADPLLLQVLPQAVEMGITPGYKSDPLEEASHNPVPGLIHKYQSRVLVVLSGGCAINCRYCFRRHFPYEENQLGSNQWQQVVDYIKQDQRINEVIFSGGDPLATSDHRLQKLISSLTEIPHLQRLRIHSRLPIVIPQRVTTELIDALTHSRLQTLMVVHANHPNEIDDHVGKALQLMHQAGITVLNQSVLLKDVNDSTEPLVTLSERLFAFNVMPYYLHLLDRVQGAEHFEVSEQKAKKLILAMQAQLPGYLVPKLVREEPNKMSKTLIDLAFD